MFSILLALALLPPLQAKEAPVTPHHARGTFTVDVKPLTPTPATGISRYSINKTLHGDLEGTTQGEMFGAGDFTKGTAGYVAIELVTATLAGHHGSFVLQHNATMDYAGPHMNVQISPGSGTGELTGIAGTFTIIMEAGKHSYDLEYTLPATVTR